MVNIDNILEMLDWNNDVAVQEKGIKLAGKVKCINAFLRQGTVLCPESRDTEPSPVLLTAYDGQSFGYDQIGNITGDGTWTYTWQHGRQLDSMTDENTEWEYTYNSDGLRTKRTDETTTYSYVYNGSQLTAMTMGENTLYFSYDAAGAPMSVNYNGTEYFYTTNIQGDVTGIVNSSGVTVVTYSYSAWGEQLNCTGSMATTLGDLNPLRYRGYVYDQETGLYYLQSRYYNPAIGRFINGDNYISTGQWPFGDNMFAYCLNNPIRYCDDGGDMADSPGAAAGEEFMIFLYELFTGEEHPSRQAKQYEIKVQEEQIEMAKDTGEAVSNWFEAAWDAYVHSQELEAEMQYRQHMATRDFIYDRFSTPEKTRNTLVAIGITLEIASYLTAPFPAVSKALFLASCAISVAALSIDVSQEE